MATQDHTADGDEITPAPRTLTELADVLIPTPNASMGVLRRQFGSIPYVIRGDVIPAQIGLGIGITVRLSGYGPGQIVTVRIEPPVGDVGYWNKEIDRNHPA